MSTAAPTITCPFCDNPLPHDIAECPQCHAGPDVQELMLAIDYAERRFPNNRAIADYYRQERERLKQGVRDGARITITGSLPPRGRCWSCKTEIDSEQDYCDDCGAPVSGPPVRSYRFLHFLAGEIKKHEAEGRITLARAHEVMAEARERISALRHRLERQRAVEVTAADVMKEPRPRRTGPPPKAPKVPAAPRRSVWEILLDPRSVQWLLGTGGALFVVGLVIVLWSLEVFQYPIVTAIALGLGTAVLMAGGWAVIAYTRFQLAGRALTLLACLVMPLNIWYYYASDLMLEHLWMPALVCCVVYAISAWLLRDHLFVYVFMGGLTLTGVLILLELPRSGGKAVIAMSTLFVGLGLLGLHAERAFPEGEGPFARRRFGLAFFWSGHALLAAGLLLVLATQLVGLFHPILSLIWRQLEVPALVAQRSQQFMALGLVLAGTWAYLWSDLVVRRVGVYVYLAAFTLLWAELLGINLIGLPVEPEVLVIFTLSLTALAANVFQVQVAGEQKFARWLAPLGLALSLLPLLLAIVLHYRATNRDLHEVWRFEVSVPYVVALLTTAVCCRIGAYLYRRTEPRVSMAYFFFTALATLLGAAGLSNLIGLHNWELQAPVLMLIPIAYLVASRLYRGRSPELPLLWVAHATTAVMIVSSIWAALEITPQVVNSITGRPLNLLMGIFCAEAAAFYVLATVFRKGGYNVYLATAMTAGAVWQFLSFFGCPPEYYTLAFALVGMALLIGYRMAVLEQFQQGGLAGAAFQCANAFLSLAFLAAVLQNFTYLLLDRISWSVVGLLALLTVLSLLAVGLVQDQRWRRWYVVTTIGQALLTVIMLHHFIRLNPWQNVEIVAVVLGLILLVAGHLGWYREQERTNDLVTLALFFGSLLAGLPLAIATIVHRFGYEISLVDEIALVTVAIALFGSGYMCRIMSTTIIGAVLAVGYLVVVIVYMHRYLSQMWIVGIYLVLGGAVLFGAGLLLSVYRDRLLTLPTRIKRREGIFRVLGWR